MELYTDTIQADAEPNSEEYLEAFLYTRNENMVDKIIGYFETGNTYFYVVGALHFEGERGIISLLKEKGYDALEVIY